MANDMIRNRSNITPLILRVAVAGALAFAGAVQLRNDSAPLPVNPAATPSADPEGIELVPNQADALAPANGASLADGATLTDSATLADDAASGNDLGIKERIGSAISDKANQVLSTTHVDPSGVQVNMKWQEFTGLAELSLAAVLLLGAFVRLTSLVGVGASTMGTLAGTGMVSSEGAFGPLASMFQANPLAMMLIGAICFTLLCSGSGPLSLDRVMFGRRKFVEAAE